MKLPRSMKRVFVHPTVRKLMVFLVVATACGCIGTAVLTSKPEVKASTRTAKGEAGAPVTVRTIEARDHPAIITALGEVQPRWRASIKARVDGQVVYLSDGLRVGNIVKRGQLLVRLEKTAFEMRVAEAESSLASARFALLREEREAREARKNWTRSGFEGEPESPLVFREPQLETARAEVKAARASLAHAETLLGWTDIRAPFDGVVTRRGVGPGEMLFAGDEAAALNGMKVAEVGVHLDAAQWALLPGTLHDARVRLIDPRQGASWTAEVVRESRRLDGESRLRTLFLQVKRPLDLRPPLLPGTFVRAEITGRSIPNLLRVPETALTGRGVVWFVDPGDRLAPVRAVPVFHGDGVVYIRASEEMGASPRIAVSPNSSFIQGLAVKPMANREEG